MCTHIVSTHIHFSHSMASPGPQLPRSHLASACRSRTLPHPPACATLAPRRRCWACLPKGCRTAGQEPQQQLHQLQQLLTHTTRGQVEQEAVVLRGTRRATPRVGARVGALLAVAVAAAAREHGC